MLSMIQVRDFQMIMDCNSFRIGYNIQKFVNKVYVVYLGTFFFCRENV